MDEPAIRWDVVNNGRVIVYAATTSLLQRLHRMFRDHALMSRLEKDHIVLEESFLQAVKACEADLGVVLLKGEKRPA